MNDMNVRRFGEKWDGADANAKRVLKEFIDGVEENIERHNLPAMMVADMHQVIANRLYSEFEEIKMEGGVPYGELAPGTVFCRGAFEFIKPNDAARYVRPVGGGAHWEFPDSTIVHLVNLTQP